MASRHRLNVERLNVSHEHGIGILRIRYEDLKMLEKHVFQRYPHREWGTFFRFGYRRTPWGIAICYVDGLWPGPGDLDRQSSLTKFDECYARRAFHESNRIDGLAVGVVHSHPMGCRVSPSELDDDMDRYFASEMTSFGRGAPYCSLILERSEVPNFSGRIHDRGRWLPVESLICVGASVDRWRSQLRPEITGVLDSSHESPSARLQQVLGIGSEQRLSDATVGVVGNSGTGSPAIEVLARARVGRFVLVDPERLSRSNLERVHGSEWRHLASVPPPYKVELARDLILSINPQAEVIPLAGNILHANALDELVKCDFILGCTDSTHGRVALDEIARHYLVPVIDVGVRMNGSDGSVTEQLVNLSAFAPGLPCSFCRGAVDAYAMSYELMSECEREAKARYAEEAKATGINADQYWKGQPPQLHTVGYLTTTSGAMVAGYVLGALTGSFRIPHPEFQFDIGKPSLGFVAPPLEFYPDCSCRNQIGWGDAALLSKNVSLPPHWSRRAIRLPDRPNTTEVPFAETA